MIENDVAKGEDENGQEEEEEEEEEAEYARFLEAERRDFLREKQRAIVPGREAHRMISTRRKVRELDSMAGAEQTLDYDDETPIETSQSPSATIHNLNDARPRFLWPALGS